jgi:hypothetical protein
MPRDLSGNYALPPENPVVDGTTIETIWANPTLDDIALQLNNVVTRDGVASPTAPIRFASGTAAIPSISFLADTGLGFYRISSNTMGWASSGIARGSVNSSGNHVLNKATTGVTLLVSDITVTGTIDGNATFSGAALGASPSVPAQFATKEYVDAIAVSTYSDNTTAIAVATYLGLI